MKIELEPQDIEAIAQRVLDLLKPYLVSKEDRTERKGSKRPKGEYLRSEHLSEYLQISLSTVRSWIYQRKIPYFKFGRKVFFKRSDIERWAEDRKVRASYDERIPRWK